MLHKIFWFLDFFNPMHYCTRLNGKKVFFLASLAIPKLPFFLAEISREDSWNYILEDGIMQVLSIWVLRRILGSTIGGISSRFYLKFQYNLNLGYFLLSSLYAFLPLWVPYKDTIGRKSSRVFESYLRHLIFLVAQTLNDKNILHKRLKNCQNSIKIANPRLLSLKFSVRPEYSELA